MVDSPGALPWDISVQASAMTEGKVSYAVQLGAPIAGHMLSEREGAEVVRVSILDEVTLSRPSKLGPAAATICVDTGPE